MKNYNYPTSAREITKALNNTGVKTSTSFGRNAGSVVTMGSSGIKTKGYNQFDARLVENGNVTHKFKLYEVEVTRVEPTDVYNALVDAGFRILERNFTQGSYEKGTIALSKGWQDISKERVEDGVGYRIYVHGQIIK